MKHLRSSADRGSHRIHGNRFQPVVDSDVFARVGGYFGRIAQDRFLRAGESESGSKEACSPASVREMDTPRRVHSVALELALVLKDARQDQAHAPSPLESLKCVLSLSMATIFDIPPTSLLPCKGSPPSSSPRTGTTSAFWSAQPDDRVRRILLCIDLTESVLDEAVRKKADAIVAYHPPIFSPRGRQSPTPMQAGGSCCGRWPRAWRSTPPTPPQTRR